MKISLGLPRTLNPGYCVCLPYKVMDCLCLGNGMNEGEVSLLSFLAFPFKKHSTLPFTWASGACWCTIGPCSHSVSPEGCGGGTPIYAGKSRAKRCQVGALRSWGKFRAQPGLESGSFDSRFFDPFPPSYFPRVPLPGLPGDHQLPPVDIAHERPSISSDLECVFCYSSLFFWLRGMGDPSSPTRVRTYWKVKA